MPLCISHIRALIAPTRRLPLELEKAMIDSRDANPLFGSRLDIADGLLTLTTPTTTYTRRLAVTAPTTRPKSQGQA